MSTFANQVYKQRNFILWPVPGFQFRIQKIETTDTAQLSGDDPLPAQFLPTEGADLPTLPFSLLRAQRRLLQVSKIAGVARVLFVVWRRVRLWTRFLKFQG